MCNLTKLTRCSEWLCVASSEDVVNVRRGGRLTFDIAEQWLVRP